MLAAGYFLISGILHLLYGFKVLRDKQYVYVRRIGIRRIKEELLRTDKTAVMIYALSMFISSGLALFAIMYSLYVDFLTAMFWGNFSIWMVRITGFGLAEIASQRSDNSVTP
jgi:hypothetical protein